MIFHGNLQSNVCPNNTLTNSLWLPNRFKTLLTVLVHWRLCNRGFFNPAIQTKIFSQSRNRDGLYRPIPIPIIKVFSVHYLNLKGPLRWVIIFSTSIYPFKFLFTVRRNFISLHQNDDIVHLRSFQSFARITYTSQGNDFLPFNFDNGKMYQ